MADLNAETLKQYLQSAGKIITISLYLYIQWNYKKRVKMKIFLDKQNLVCTPQRPSKDTSEGWTPGRKEMYQEGRSFLLHFKEESRQKWNLKQTYIRGQWIRNIL